MLHKIKEHHTSAMVTVVMKEIVITPTTLVTQRRRRLLTTKEEIGRVVLKFHLYTLVIMRETKVETNLQRSLGAQCSIGWGRMAHEGI